MDQKQKRKELLRLNDRDLVNRILAYPDREKLNRDEDGKRRKYPSAEMAVRARRSMEKNPDYQISSKQRFVMADSFAQYSSDQLKVAGIKFANADPNLLDKTEVSKEGTKTVYEMQYHLIPEPENQHDKNAVAVCVKNQNDEELTRIGYLPGSYVSGHPIMQPMTAKGTLTDHSNGHFKTISYLIDMDTEAICKANASLLAGNKYTYQMPFQLNGPAKEGAAEYLNSQTWTDADGLRSGWAGRINDEFEYWSINGKVDDVRFEFPGGNVGNIIIETREPLSGEAMDTCNSYLHYTLESGISADLKREGLVDCPANVSHAVNTRERTYLSLKGEPARSQDDDFAKALESLGDDGGFSI